jgi:nicotinamide-nucleotide amidase
METNCSEQTYAGISISGTIQQCLHDLDEKVVFAESCTGGEIVSSMAKLPGISKNLCGSFVSYRPSSKQKWLGVDCRTIEKHTTESVEVAIEMAEGALKKTPEATWALSVVGHFGPNAPEDKDGTIYICVMRRTLKGKLKVKEVLIHKLSGTSDRVVRQNIATDVCLTTLARILIKRNAPNRTISDTV